MPSAWPWWRPPSQACARDRRRGAEEARRKERPARLRTTSSQTSWRWTLFPRAALPSSSSITQLARQWAGAEAGLPSSERQRTRRGCTVSGCRAVLTLLLLLCVDLRCHHFFQSLKHLNTTKQDQSHAHAYVTTVTSAQSAINQRMFLSPFPIVSSASVQQETASSLLTCHALYLLNVWHHYLAWITYPKKWKNQSIFYHTPCPPRCLIAWWGNVGAATKNPIEQQELKKITLHDILQKEKVHKIIRLIQQKKSKQKQPWECWRIVNAPCSPKNTLQKINKIQIRLITYNI